jgi:hypothetical protein
MQDIEATIKINTKIEWLGTLPVKVVGYMAAILTPEDVVRRIAAECAYLDERGGVGIRLEPAAAIVRQYGQQFRAPRRQRRPRSAKPPSLL